MFRQRLLVVLLLSLVVGACGRAPDAKPAAQSQQAPAPLLVAPEDVRVVGRDDAAQGPVITGSIQPERRADLRAEVSAVVLQVLKENGEPVHVGDLLVKLDDTAIRDSLASAEEAARAAGQAFEQAQRQVERQKTLQAQGMTSMQALEDAEVRRNSAQSDLVAAKARVVSARQQLQRTLVRAPFDGIVSDRKVSGGDTAQVGKELLKVIDPGSMRFEGLVSADRMQDVRVGQEVHFRINGFPQRDFAGKVKRVDATANEMTRQVSVLVSFVDPANAPHVAGLYAEGRVSMPAGTHRVLALPEGSIVRSGNAPFVWQIKSDGKLHKSVVQIGARDARTGEYPLLAGLSEGDRILRAPSDSLTDGQAVEYSGGHAAAASTPAAR